MPDLVVRERYVQGTTAAAPTTHSGKLGINSEILPVFQEIPPKGKVKDVNLEYMVRSATDKSLRQYSKHQIMVMVIPGPKEADTALFQAARDTATAFNLDSSQNDHLTEALTDLITSQARQAAEDLRQSGTQWKNAHHTDEVSGPYTLYSSDGTPLSDYEQGRLLHTAHSEAYRLMGSLNSAPHGWKDEEQAREKIQEAIDELNALRFPPDPPEQPPGVMECIANLFRRSN